MSNKTVLSLSVGLAIGLAGGAASALPGFNGAETMSINPGSFALFCTHDTSLAGGNCLTTGVQPIDSYFFMGGGAYGTTLLTGFNGITLGVGQPAGSGSHTGAPVGSDTGSITAPWGFFKNTGHEFSVGTGIGTSAATTDAASVGTNFALGHPNADGHHFLDFSNWRVTWAGIPSINMSGGTQDCGTSTDGICDADGSGTDFGDIAGTFFNGTGLAHVACFTDSARTVPQTSCSNSSFYVSEYAAIVPQADPSGFGGVLYEVTLTGDIAPHVPIPAAAWLFGSGMLGLVGVARRRKAIKKA